MIYTGQFTSRNDVVYTVEMNNTATQNGTTEIKLGSTPFIVNYEGGDTIFKPTKLSSATITIVTGDYINVYSPIPNTVSVTLKHGNEIIWKGYTTPSVYSQELNDHLKEIEIECIDDLAALRYFYFGQHLFNSVNAPQVKSLLQISKEILSAKTAYTNLYFPKKFQTSINSADTYIGLQHLFVDEANFIEDLKIENGTVYNNKWTCLSVLEEIANITNTQIIAHGLSLYFVPIGSTSTTNYYNYSVQNNTTQDATISNTQTTVIPSYIDNATLSMAEPFKKVSVEAEVKERESVIKDLFDESQLTNITTPHWDSTMSGAFNRNPNDYATDWGKVEGKHFVITPNQTGSSVSLASKEYFIIRKYLKNANYDCYKNGAIIDAESISYTDLESGTGAYLVYENDVNGTEYGADATIVSNPTKAEMQLDNFTPLLIITKTPTAAIDYRNRTNLITVFKSKQNNNLSLFDNDKLTMTCKMKIGGVNQTYNYNNPYNVSASTTATKFYIPFKLKIGDKYLTNIHPQYTDIDNVWSWSDTEAIGRLKFTLSAEDRKQYIFKEYSMKPIDVYIPTGCFGKSVEFELYAPNINNTSHNVLLSNFSIQIKNQPSLNYKKGESSSNTLYTNVVNNSYISDGGEVTCKINTYDNKVNSYSSLLVGNSASALTVIDEIKLIKSNETHRLEEHKIYEMVNQYQAPRKVYDVEISNLIIEPKLAYKLADITSWLYADTAEIDYYNTISRVKFIELA